MEIIPSFPLPIDRPSLQDPQAPDRGYASYFKVEGLLAGDDWVVFPMVFRMILPPKKNNLYHVFSESGDRFFSSSIIDLSTTDLGYSWLMMSLVIKKKNTKTREYQNPWGIQFSTSSSSEDTWFCTASIKMGWWLNIPAYLFVTGAKNHQMNHTNQRAETGKTRNQSTHAILRNYTPGGIALHLIPFGASELKKNEARDCKKTIFWCFSMYLFVSLFLCFILSARNSQSV